MPLGVLGHPPRHGLLQLRLQPPRPARPKVPLLVSITSLSPQSPSHLSVSLSLTSISHPLALRPRINYLLRCWIEGEHVAARMLFYYGPLVFMWGFNAALYLYLLYKFHLARNSDNNAAHRRATRYTCF